MKLTVSGIPGLDGEYTENLSTINNQEWHVIKKETGLRAGELSEALTAGDVDAMVAFAAIVLTRAGKQDVWPLLWEADVTKLTFDFTDEEQAEEPSPPVSATPSSPGGEPPEPPRPGVENGSSGTSLSVVGENPVSDLKATGSLL